MHGDDYTSVASPEDVQWLKMELEKKYELKTNILGHNNGAKKEGKALNRVVRYTEKGIEDEAD